MKIKIRERTLEQGIILALIVSIVLSVIVGITFTTDYVVSYNVSNKSVIAVVNITNTDPNITGIRIDDGIFTQPEEIDLVANDAVTVTCNATIFDYNGYRDITEVVKTNATFFITSVGINGEVDNNSLYVNRSCGSCRQAISSESYRGDTARTAICDCKFAVQYYANYSDQWTCGFSVEDNGGNQISELEINISDTDQNSSGVTVTQLLAIDAPVILDYGNLSVTQYSNEIIHNVTNVGNVPFNLSLRGFGGINDSVDHAGHNLTMICDYGNISIGNQRYSTTSGNAFASMRILQNQTEILTGFTNPEVNLTWPQRTDDTNYGSDRNSTYWMMYVPTGVGGLCNGTIIFGAIDATGS